MGNTVTVIFGILEKMIWQLRSFLVAIPSVKKRIKKRIGEKVVRHRHLNKVGMAHSYKAGYLIENETLCKLSI